MQSRDGTLHAHSAYHDYTNTYPLYPTSPNSHKKANFWISQKLPKSQLLLQAENFAPRVVGSNSLSVLIKNRSSVSQVWYTRWGDARSCQHHWFCPLRRWFLKYWCKRLGMCEWRQILWAGVTGSTFSADNLELRLCGDLSDTRATFEDLGDFGVKSDSELPSNPQGPV